MAYAIDRVTTFGRGGPRPLDQTTPGPVNRTYLIKIFEPSSRRIHARWRMFGWDLSDAEIREQFSSPPTGEWEKIPHIGKSSRIDISIKQPTGTQPGEFQKWATIAFALSNNLHNDLFILDNNGGPSWAVSGGEPDALLRLFNPAWVPDGDIIDGRVVKVHAADGAYNVQYVLGINVVDGDDETIATPTFIDPKIENVGG